ncbi:hypothetical protein HJC23_004202 [Cyclotella cryptica]|uniref:J domain-containing protein n=1 Tax=Cyclotella cryptica TaxID=29204 RepID=A0ABD3Q8B5_9STRA|eukprot:CCRYP_007832-RA/>CCRYP_007832-RA protein AED:0.00 eAED:0.00 QI:245/-1/1/1/-1/1/1/200/702
MRTIPQTKRRQMILIVSLLRVCIYPASWPRIAVTNVAEAKLMLWPEQDEEEFLSSRIHEARRTVPNNNNKKTDAESSSSSIHDRLRLFRHDDEDGNLITKTSPFSYALSPAKYLTLMLRYLQNQLSGLSSYLYLNDEASSSSPSSSSWAYSLFRQAHYQNMIAEPKDAWEGLLSAFSAMKTGYLGGMQFLVDGVYELGYGSISACLALLPSQSGSAEYAPVYSFLTEITIGLSKSVDHAKDGLLLFAAGAVVGTRNLVVGIARTPEAVRSSRLGMLYYPMGKKELKTDDPYSSSQQVAVWDYYSLDYEDKEIQMEEARMKIETDSLSKADRKPDALRKRRRHVPVKDRKFYDILGVSTNANSKEIRSAYRREALRRHPDKQQQASLPTLDQTIPQHTSSIEGFLDLTEAYRILSNDASREAYDEYGMCYRNHPSDAFQAEATQDLISELFGADAVKNYVGDVEIASIVNEVFGFSSDGDNSELPTSVEKKNLRQRRRVVNIAKYLRGRVNTFVRGEITLEQFSLSCRKEVDFILREGADVDFVAVIGRTLLQEADQRLGHVLPFVKRVGSDFAQVVTSKVASARVYGPIYFRIALEGMLSGSHYNRREPDEGDCSGGNLSDRHLVDQDAVLDLLWQYIVNDTVATLREACNKLFADQGVRDGNLAFVKTQSLLKYQRAEAVRILGREFLAASSGASKDNHPQ